MTTPFDFIQAGWYIFPCHTIVRGHCTCQRGAECDSPGKHPRTKNGVKDATIDDMVVQSWIIRWGTEINWGLACGAMSNVLCVDVDAKKNGYHSLEQLEINREAGPLPETLTTITGGGGRHLFFQAPSVAVGNRVEWLPGIDIRSDGGYVILAPGAHISGGQYQWLNWGQPLAVLPEDLVNSIKATPSGSGKELPPTDDILRGVPEGKRDDVLFRACCRWRRQLGNNYEAVRTLALATAQNCDPPFPADQAIKCVDSAFKQDHTDSTQVRRAGEEGDGFHPLTDLGNAYRFVDAYGEDVIYVEGWGWLVWTATGWSRDGMGTVAKMSHSISTIIQQEKQAMIAAKEDMKTVAAHQVWAAKSESAGAISAVTRLAKDVPSIRKPVEEFDAEDWLLACRNGIVNLKTGEIRPTDRNDLVTKNTGVIYDPDFEWPRWQQFLEEATQGDAEMIQYLQRSMGYTLTGSNAEECFFMLSGPPASGKSTFLDALHVALGTYGTVTQPETFMYRKGQQTAPNELARLAGMRLVSMNEIREGDSFSESTIKQFTGGDRVTARFLYQDSFEFRPQLKLWIGTNNDPNVFDDALWRRMKKIPFMHTIPVERRDPALKLSIRDPEIGGRAILAWAVQGAMQWYKEGSLAQPASITAEVTQYRMEQDRPGAFISETLTSADANSWVPMNQLYQLYRMWCVRTGELPKRSAQFRKMMESRGLKSAMNDAGQVFFNGVAIRSGVNQWS